MEKNDENIEDTKQSTNHRRERSVNIIQSESTPVMITVSIIFKLHSLVCCCSRLREESLAGCEAESWPGESSSCWSGMISHTQSWIQEMMMMSEVEQVWRMSGEWGCEDCQSQTFSENIYHQLVSHIFDSFTSLERVQQQWWQQTWYLYPNYS